MAMIEKNILIMNFILMIDSHIIWCIYIYDKNAFNNNNLLNYKIIENR